MKKIISTILLLLCTISFFNTSAQPWMEKPYLEKNKDEANFYDIQKAFYKYWNGRPYEKGKGFKQFKRWEYDMTPKCYPDGKLPSPTKYADEYRKFIKQSANYDNKAKSSFWTPLGLTSWTNGLSGYNPGNGRLNAVTVDPTNPNIIYVAAPSGGIWKSIDKGQTWNTTFDTMKVLGTSAIAIHPQNPDIIFIGTGDRDAWDSKGTGIYKSTDGGNTWHPGGLNFLPSYRNINKIIINPLNPNRMYAAASDGIYRSKNGGNTWQKVYAGEVKDLKFKPNDTSVIYGSGKYFVRSVNAGNSFQRNITTLPNDTVRLEFDVTPANPEYVYVVVARPDNTFEGVYRSTDGGATFTARCNSPNILGYSDDGSDNAGQAWYDLAIAVSPIDENVVFVGGINVWKSVDGGATFTVNTMWYTGSPYTYIHCDIHSLNFYGNTLYCGSDGGIFYTDDFGDTWHDISNGLGIAQFYAMNSPESKPYMISAGAQDIGTNLLQNGQWIHLFGADGMESIISNFNTQTIYISCQMGDIYKSITGGLFFTSVKPHDTLQGGWLTPYVMRNDNNLILYAGYQDIYKTTNGAITWTKLTDDLCNGFDINELCLAPSNPLYMYASQGETLYITKDDWNTWSSVKPAPGKFITGIAVDANNEERIWITTSSYYGDNVFYSPDAGNTFIDITGNLTNLGFNCIVHQKNAHDALYIGTETGVVFKDSTMSQWIPYNFDLPNVKVTELEINYSIGMIRAATYGRGIWEAPLYNYTANCNTLKENDFIVLPNPTYTGTLRILPKTIIEKKTDIFLFNVVGTLIKHLEINNPANEISLDVSTLVSGSYFVKICNDKNCSTYKVVILN